MERRVESRVLFRVSIVGVVCLILVWISNTSYYGFGTHVQDPHILALGIGDTMVFSAQPSPNPIRVPQDYSTIQAAIDAAANGSTILVFPGIYHENLRIHKPLELYSYPYGAILESNSKEPAILIEDADMVTLAALQIRLQISGGNESTGIEVIGKSKAHVIMNRLAGWTISIHIRSTASATIEKNILQTEVSGSGYDVSGISVEEAEAQISENKLYIGSHSEYVGGIVGDKSHLNIIENEVYILEGSAAGAEALFLFNSQGRVADNRIFANHAEGIVIDGSLGLTLQRNFIVTPDSLGIVMSKLTQQSELGLVMIRENNLSGGQSPASGIGVNEMRAEIEGNTISGYAVGISIGSEAQVQVKDNLIDGNQDGVVINRGASSALLEYNRILSNRGCGVRIEQALPERVKLQIVEGRGNWIAGNQEGDLCPTNFPWPPGFLKP